MNCTFVDFGIGREGNGYDFLSMGICDDVVIGSPKVDLREIGTGEASCVSFQGRDLVSLERRRSNNFGLSSAMIFGGIRLSLRIAE